MKKISRTIIVAVSLLFALQSCESQKVVVNREVDSKNDGKMLLGTQTKSQLQKAPYSDWFDQEYKDYVMDDASIKDLRKEKFSTYNLTVFLGTWCEDSHREVPRLMKILDTLNFPENKLTIIAVNRKKESPNGEEGLYNIQKVPTIIVQKYGNELGRIIEFPKSGFLEKDLLEIIKKDNTTSVKDIFK